MLRKLLKHEFRATGRIMGPLYLIVLATAIGGNLSVRLMDDSSSRAINILAGLLMTAFVAAMIGVCVMSVVLMIQRFYKNLMGDEGYIMFTLPASIHQQIWSKIIVSTVWFAATAVAMMVAMLVLVYDVGFMTQAIEALREILQYVTAYYALNGVAFFLELLVVCFLAGAVCCLQFYAAMAIGHSFANHKVALSVVFYFVLQFAMQLVFSFLVLGFDNVNFDWLNQMMENMEFMPVIHLAMGVSAAAVVVYGALYYILTTFFLKKHLNLE